MLCNSTTGFVFCVYLTYSSPAERPLFFGFWTKNGQNKQEKSLKTVFFGQIVVEHIGFEPVTSTMRM